MKRLSFVLAFVAGCAGGTETGNPADSSSFSLHTSDKHIARLDDDGDGARIDAAWLVIAEADFVIGRDCSDADVEVEIEQERVVDLNASNPFMEFVEFGDGVICSVEMESARPRSTLPADAPPALAGATMVVEGISPLGVPFSIVIEDDLAWEAEALLDAGFGNGSTERLVVTFDVARWLRGIDLDALDAQDDGAILLSGDVNEDARERFEENVARSLVLVDDVDADGRFTPGEAVLARSE